MARRTRTGDLRDVGVFAEKLLGEPLFPHQLEAARSEARFRMLLAGRRVGKSRLLAVLALHHAFTRAEQYVLVMSHGEDGAQGVLEEASALLASPLLQGSVDADDKTLIRLTNGSTIRCVPASQKRVRGKGADLLILDEACFIDEELWNAAKFTVLANAGSRVVLASSPYGRRDRFFAQYWSRGMAKGHDGSMYASWRWPSTESPLVDQILLAEWKKTDPPRVYAREVEAEWVDEAGQYFTSDELDAAEVDYQMTPPEEADGDLVVCGLDWGFSVDSSAMALLGVLDDGGLGNEAVVGHEAVWGFRWLEEAPPRTPYAKFIDRVARAGSWRGRGFGNRNDPGYVYRYVVSEANGVGAMPTQELRRRFREHFYAELEHGTHRQMGTVHAVHTTARRKEAAFGTAKLLMQQGRLLLPHHAGLRRQLETLEYETSETGSVRISVPETVGHDDLAMAAAQAVSCIRLRSMPRSDWSNPRGSTGDVLMAPCGTRIRQYPRALDARGWMTSPRGDTTTDDDY